MNTQTTAQNSQALNDKSVFNILTEIKDVVNNELHSYSIEAIIETQNKLLVHFFEQSNNEISTYTPLALANIVGDTMAVIKALHKLDVLMAKYNQITLQVV